MTAERDRTLNDRGSETAAPDEPLAHRVIRGGVWAFVLRISFLVLYFVRIIILARILAPKDFGSVGMALLVMSILEAFTQTGTLQALIQRKDDIRSYLDAAWTISVLRGACLGGILFAAAPLAAAFFSASEIAPLVRGYGIALFINGFINTGVVEFPKNLRFDRQALFHFGANASNFIVVVGAAFILRSVWAFVIADIAYRIALVVLSFRLHPYRPKWAWEPARFRELFRFGRWVTGSGALQFLTTQGDDIFVGKVLGSTMLGFYQMAYKISNTPTTEVSSVIGQVMFPTYAQLQGDTGRLREAFFKTFQITIAPAFILLALLSALGADIVRVLLGEKWLPMVPAMRILALAGTARAAMAMIGDLLFGVGRPRTQTAWEFVRLLVMAAVLVPLTLKFGLTGASAAVLISLVVPLAGFASGLRRETAAGRWQFARYLLVPAAGGAAMGGTCAGLRLVVGGTAAGLLAAGAVGVLVFFAVHFLLERELEYRSIDFYRDRVRPLVRELGRKIKGSRPEAAGGSR
jgi:O-antigen/teichoic acid export membrane protein